MANWQGAILTNKGRSLQAKVEGGLCQLALTKLKTGDGTLAPGQTLEALTDLVSPKQNIAISAVVVDENQPGVVYGIYETKRKVRTEHIWNNRSITRKLHRNISGMI